MKKALSFFVISLVLVLNAANAQDLNTIFGRAAATDVYVMEFFTNPGQFGTIPLAGPYYPIPNIITGNAFTMLGGDFDDANNLYTFVYTDPDYDLGLVDLNTGAVNYVATVSGVVSTQQFLSQLSYNVIDGKFYAMSHDPNNNNGSQLYSVSISTGVLTPIGPLDAIANAIAFEIDNNGIAYSADAVTGKLYTIDLISGVASEVGVMSQNGFYPVGQGFSIDRDNNTMYAVLQNRSGVIRSHFYTVNLSNGALTDLGDGSSRKYVLFAIADHPLGLDMVSLESITVYPNPASKILKIGNTKGLVLKSAKLYDMFGRNTGIVLANSEMNIESLVKGIYILFLETANASITKKIIKK